MNNQLNWIKYLKHGESFYLSSVYRQERIIDLFSSTKMETVQTTAFSQYFFIEPTMLLGMKKV